MAEGTIAIPHIYDLGAQSSLPNTFAQGISCFVITKNITVGSKTIPIGSRIFGYSIGSIFKGIAIGNEGNNLYQMLFSSESGNWSVW